MAKTLSADEVAQADDAIILDVLASESYENRHLPGAVNLPLSSDDFDQRVRRLVPDLGQKLIVYCGGPDCTASTAATERLVSLGYRNVFEFEGGLEEWRETGRAFEGGGARVRAEASRPDEVAASGE